MKFNSIIYLVFLVVATLTSCKKDEKDTCVPPALAKNIIGTWTVTVTVFGQTETGKVNFNADGTVKDDENFLIVASLNGQDLTNKTWAVSANEKELEVTASKSSVGSVSQTYTIESQTCNTIETSVFGGLAKVTFTR